MYPAESKRPKWIGGGIVAMALLAGASLVHWAGGNPAGPEIELGVNKSLQGRQVFPADDPWNKDVSKDEVAEQKAIKHAIRFTIVKSRRAYVHPATHYASNKTDPNLPPMGMRVRLKAGYDISKFSPANQMILQALKTYGMIVADNGGDWFISGAPDPRWDDEDLHKLTTVKGADFEVMKMGQVTTR
ncbi:MAG: hypothetical protein JWL69_5139 [Phycisphaerales bacterium]|nr:hypothetical protein [Phycisphaerales bacterium]MDB5354428.1 hypothetical protein [Phycisphaerales bacterium]